MDEGIDEGIDEMIDESRDDFIDNDGDWSLADDVGLNGDESGGLSLECWITCLLPVQEPAFLVSRTLIRRMYRSPIRWD